ncbi:excalibur calcium-binding domain-containing protein [Rathayibacter iranicus]|uniref:excalibur calcium-binding domain-containing protein n=1 Tax=Rathayibacter iranicus TaxID=59737 RepID=UPI00235193C4|nr:excalibur calcium-binding domain-containing protein [Rathayibacter iranicus]
MEHLVSTGNQRWDNPASSTPGGGSVSYANCTEVRAAGADPIRAGDAGYSRSLDRDGDGIACE